MRQSLLMIIILLSLSLSTHSQAKDNPRKDQRKLKRQQRHANVAHNPNNTAVDFIGTIYSSLPYFPDDDPKGFTQTFGRISFKRNCFSEGRDTIPCHKFLFARNCMGEVSYSANANSIKPFYDTSDHSGNAIRYVNRLDLYQNSYLRINIFENVLTFIPDHQNNWITHLYLDAFASYGRTKMTDSIQGDADLSSWLLGGSFKARFENPTNALLVPITIEVSTQVFWINYTTNQNISSDLNFQYQDNQFRNSQLYTDRRLTTNPYPYTRFDLLFMFPLGQSANAPNIANGTSNVNSDKGNNSLFIHLGYTTNLLTASKTDFHNSYFQAQLGISVDLKRVLNQLSGIRNNNGNPPASQVAPSTQAPGSTSPSTATPPSIPANATSH